MNVGQLHKRLKGITQSALSQHLTLLRANRIVECDKQGQSMVYKIVDQRASGLTETVGGDLPAEGRGGDAPGRRNERAQMISRRERTGGVHI